MIHWKESSEPLVRAPKKGPLVLLIDDQPDVVRIFSRVLNQAGYETVTAVTAESALALAAEKRPDAVLADLRMPFINGVGLLYRFRRLYPRMPVAVVTGAFNLDDETTAEIKALQAPLYFKPLSNADVRDVAASLLGNAAGSTERSYVESGFSRTSPQPA